MNHGLLFLFVCLCGGSGAACRFILDTAIKRVWSRSFPLSTTIINLLASLLLGLIMGLLAGSGDGPGVIISQRWPGRLQDGRHQRLPGRVLHLFDRDQRVKGAPAKGEEGNRGRLSGCVHDRSRLVRLGRLRFGDGPQTVVYSKRKPVMPKERSRKNDNHGWR